MMDHIFIIWHFLLNLFQDYVGNKRLELSGQLISLLFEVFSLIILVHVIFYVLTSFFREGFVQNDELQCCGAYEQNK